MTGHMTSRTKAGLFTFFAFGTLLLAGCGNHDQAGTGGSGTMTSAQIQENAKRQNETMNKPATGSTPAAPAAPATH